MKPLWLAIGIGGASAAAAVVVTLLLWDGASTPERPLAAATALHGPSPPLPAEFQFTLSTAPRPVPALAFVDGAGDPKTLADFRGRVVLLNIWATWCVPCRKEMPALDRLQAKLGGPDFQVIPLSIDRKGLDAVKPFYQELGLKSLGIYIDTSGKVSRDLGIIGVPVTLLVDREGREVARKLGPDEWDSADMIEIIRGYMELPSSIATGEKRVKQ